MAAEPWAFDDHDADLWAALALAARPALSGLIRQARRRPGSVCRLPRHRPLPAGRRAGGVRGVGRGLVASFRSWLQGVWRGPAGVPVRDVLCLLLQGHAGPTEKEDVRSRGPGRERFGRLVLWCSDPRADNVPVRLNVYVDAFNLYYGCLRKTPYKWLDLLALCQKLFPRDEIHRIRYFTALVTSRPDDPQKPQRQQVYIRAIQTLPCVTVHLGHYRSGVTRMPLATPPRIGPKTVEVMKTEEKGSDVNLATYLLLDAFKRDFEVAAVISNDSDLKEPVALVRSELGLPVGVVNPHLPKFRSYALQGTFFKQIREAAVRDSQFPPTMTDATGEIRKPADW